MTSRRPRLRVVLVSYGTAGLVERLLAGGAFADDEVIVADSASEPEEVRRVCLQHGATPLLLERNLGFAHGVNRAVAASRDHSLPVLLLNPDVELQPTALERLCAALSEPGVDGVAPLLVDGDRPAVGAAGGPVTAGSFAAYFLGVAHLLPSVRGIFWTRSQLRRGGRAHWLQMACLLLRPDAFDRFGPIPEDELVYAEDVAWGSAATARGARFVLVSDARVRHTGGASGAQGQWQGALERLARRRLGQVRGGAAVLALRAGLAPRRVVRRALGRPIP